MNLRDHMPADRAEAVERWLKTPVGKCAKCKKPVHPTDSRIGTEPKRGQHRIYHLRCAPKKLKPADTGPTRSDW